MGAGQLCQFTGQRHPGFWQHEPHLGSQHMEAQLHLRGITGEEVSSCGHCLGFPTTCLELTFVPQWLWDIGTALLGSEHTSFLLVQLFLWKLLLPVCMTLVSSTLGRTKDYTRLAQEADWIFLSSWQCSVHSVHLSPPHPRWRRRWW